MMNLAEYRRRADRLSDYLPWAALVAPSVVLNKDGSLQRSLRFRGPDLESATAATLVATAARLNNALRRFGSGWALFAEAQRLPAAGYPDSAFPDAVSWLVDQERRAMFEAEAAHFESRYYLTFLYMPPAETTARLGDLIVDKAEGAAGVDWRAVLAGFLDRTERARALLDGVMPEAAWLDDAETLTYLHACISTRRHRVTPPEVPMYLDAFLADEPLSGGLEPMLGSSHLRVTTALKFPSVTTPGLLDELNGLGFAYRWCSRWLALDKPDGQRVLNRIRRHWFAKRKSIMVLLREVLFQREAVLVDSDAHNMALDADEALQELGADLVSEGYFTATVVVWDADPASAEEKRRLVERVINGRDFTTIAETVNAVDAWLGSLPGHAYANVRQPPVSSLNLVHMLPMSAVWAGQERNVHLDGPPLLFAKTAGSTPFRLSTHVGDVGHIMVVGPTGAGKSTLLALMALQFRRYPDARVLIFDMGGSARAAVAGMGGAWHELGAGIGGSGLAFQPLARIADPAERAWAAEWLAALLRREGLALEPAEREHLWSALGALASAPAEQRTLTGLSVLLQSNRLRQALQPFTLAGPYGRLLDAEGDRLGIADVAGFELETLLETGAAAPVLAYLFHRLEQEFDGRPTLLIIDEGWLILDDEGFAAQLREWEKTARKKNVAILFATQSLADIESSPIAASIIESCPARIFLPNDRAIEPQIRASYEHFGLNQRQIEIIAQAQPKGHYYLQSRQGNRLFELGLGPATLAFVGTSTKPDLARIEALLREFGPEALAAVWLQERGLDWAAELVAGWQPADIPDRRAA
ncbi:MAG: conjugal transfer protein TrbE [Azospirillum sp.]|nr:conjugal transfer protein TrbE [Azospirillum sp.]